MKKIVTLILLLVFVQGKSFSQEKKSKEYYDIALQYYQANDYLKAIEFSTKAIELNQNFSKSYLLRANAYYSLKRFHEAIKDCLKVIELDPKAYSAYTNMGLAKNGLKRYSEAIIAYSKSIEIKPNATAYNNRAVTYQYIGDYNLSLADANLSIQLQRNYANLDTRASTYALLKQYENAIIDFNESIKIDPTQPRVYFDRGLVKKAMNDYYGAQLDFNKAHELDSLETYKDENDPLFKFLNNVFLSDNLPPIISIQEVLLTKSILNACDTVQLLITVKNIGPGDANNVYINLTCELLGLTFQKKTNIPVISKNGGTQTARINIKSDIDIPTSEAVLKIEVIEPNFKVKIQGKQVRFPTKEFVKPILLLAKFAVIENLSSNPNNQIDINEQVDVKFAIQNIGQGKAENISIAITNDQSGVMLLGVVDNSGNLVRRNPSYTSISSGKFETITYRYFINSEFTSPQLTFNIKAIEKYGKYGFSQTKAVEINKVLQEEGSIRTIAKNDNSVKGKVVIEDIPDFVSDVDQNIPSNPVSNDKTFAVIIGNETYSKEIKVKYALNDSRIFKQYLLKTLGLPVNNIRYIENATFGEMLDAIKWLNEVTKAYKGEAKILFYYAGHGMPDEQTKSAYLLPTDGNSQNSATAVRLEYVYKELTEYPSVSVTVFLDACFSGAARENDGSMLAEARGVKIKPKNDLLTGNLVVFSATTGDETALPYAEKRHGMFTYFLLKKLQESHGNVTQNELINFITTNVTQQSVVVNKKSQTPQVNTSSQVVNTWQTMKLK
jgi:tetratricopeptide (TPR) repeat protein